MALVAESGAGALARETVRAGSLSPVRRLSDWIESEREQWFNWLPVCFGIGIAVYFSLKVEPTVVLALAPFVAAFVLKLLVRGTTLAAVLFGVLVAATAGFATAKLRTEWARGPVLTGQMRQAEVQGFVELVEPKPTRGQRLTIRVARIAGVPAEQTPRRVRVRTMASLQGVKPGDAVRVLATLGPPAGPYLPGGFDFARQAWFLGLGGNGYSMGAAEFDAAVGGLPWQMWVTGQIERVRQRIGRTVVAGLPGETGGIANALITGERGGITSATDSAYRDSGLYHILSISGLHMVVMAGAFFFVVRFGFAAVPSIALRYPIKKWAALAAALGALGYLLISGASFATVRSYIQISILFLAMLLERPALALRNVAVAALILLVIWPESLLDAGFQMSFAAVVALISGYEAIRRRQERLGRADIERGPLMTFVLFFTGIIGSTLIATLAVAPFAAYQFHTSQQYGAIANLLALPICDLFVMPAALATLMVMPLGLEAIPLWFAGWGIDTMTAIAYGVARLPGAVIAVPAIPTASFAALLTGGLWLLLWRTRVRLLGLAPIALGLALAPMQERADVIVSGDGILVAARVAGTRLSALPAPRSLYDLARWLEADGDQRPVREAARGEGYRCDAAGCIGRLRGQIVAFGRHPSALGLDCARAYVLVLNRPRPAGCSAPAVVIDLLAIRRLGTHAVYLGGATPRVETVAGLRGDRPWSSAFAGRAPVRQGGVANASARLRGFTLPAAAFARAIWPVDPAEEDEPPPAYTPAGEGPVWDGMAD